MGVAWEHGINIDFEPPAQPKIKFYSPTANQWVNNPYINITWEASYDNISGLDHYVVHIYNAKTGDIFKEILVSRENTSWETQNMPSGEWNFIIGAVDRAGNEAISQTIGPIRIDTIAPTINGFAPAIEETFYDNDTDELILRVSWSDVPSGISEVYIRYKINDRSYNFFVVGF